MKKIENIKEYYNDYFKNNEWTLLWAKYKSKNIIDLLEEKEYINILEVWSGNWSVMEYYSKDNRIINIYWIDISNGWIKQTLNKNIPKVIEIKEYDWYSIPYWDDFFDLVICTHVIEHVEHPRMILREMQRVSKEFIFEIPIDFSFFVHKKLDYFLDYWHINIFTPSLFKFLILNEWYKIKGELFRLAPLEIYKYIFKNNYFAYYLRIMKNIIFSIIPFLKKIKPNTYTIYLTK